jgi:hypothetical protein
LHPSVSGLYPTHTKALCEVKAVCSTQASPFASEILHCQHSLLSVRREQDDETLEFLTYGQVVISKAKVNETMGDTGIWNFRYNVNNGRYITDDKEKICNFDNTNWITKEEYKEPEESKLQALNPYEAFGMPKNDLFCKDGTEQDDDMPF